MLVIRMQRTGRKGHAMFRVVVQDSRRTPTSGKVVAALGSYDPHNKTITLDKEKAAFYLEHGAQPSERVAALLKVESVKLPKWVTLSAKKESSVRNADKRRSTRPAAPVEEETAAPAEAKPEAVEEVIAEAQNEAPVSEVVAPEAVEAKAEPEAPVEPAEAAEQTPEQAATTKTAEDAKASKT